MAENKTKPTKINVSTFINTIPDETRRADAKVLVKMMQKATGDEPTMWGPSIVGFGSYHYVYESGREGDMPVACFSPRKTGLVVYELLCSPEAKTLLPKLGKYTTGKGCLYIKKLADVDEKILEKLIVSAVAQRRARQHC